MRFEGECICEYCGWDSIALRAEARLATYEYQEVTKSQESVPSNRKLNVA